MSAPFLTAEWRDLLVLNYQVQPELLLPYLPSGLELDYFNGKTLVSLVAFRFLNTRVRGLRVPWHVNFEEINLRFYVRCSVAGQVRRGVVFIKELVPRAAIALVARAAYNENYYCVPMSHQRNVSGQNLEIAYSWRADGVWQSVSAAVQGEPTALAAGSEAEFIFEHYWGYCRARSGATTEYQVTHRPWRAWTNPKVILNAQLARTYGEQFAKYLSVPYSSAYLAEGSEIEVYSGKALL
ncbi:MAG: DUF2071 domain-containing protein [Oligoflexia bacterium]|nr:DUF2071 domain-containing protein [Oligoflexia bacterium]